MSWHLNHRQSVTVNVCKTGVTFRNMDEHGLQHQFYLSNDQFENFNDCLRIIFHTDSTLETEGHYTLGGIVGFYYDGFKKGRFYLMHTLKRPYFIFYELGKYFRNYHYKVLRFLRSPKDMDTTYAGERSTVRRRKRRTSRTGDHSDVATKRSHSNDVQYKFGFDFPDGESSVRTEKTLSKEAEDVDMSDAGSSCSIFSAWSYTNSRRKSDEDCSLSDLSEGEPCFTIDEPSDEQCHCSDCEK